MEQKKSFIDWDISFLLEIVLFWSRRRSIFVDLDLLLKSRFIAFQDSFILPLNFETLDAKYCRLMTLSTRAYFALLFHSMLSEYENSKNKFYEVITSIIL